MSRDADGPAPAAAGERGAVSRYVADRDRRDPGFAKMVARARQRLADELQAAPQPGAADVDGPAGGSGRA